MLCRAIILNAILFALICSQSFAQDYIQGTEQSTTPRWNEQIDRIRRMSSGNENNITQLQSDISDLEGEFSITDGHTHDGVDSKEVPVQNIDVSSITVDHFLYNDAGVIKGKGIDFPKGLKLISTTSFTNASDTGNISITNGKNYIAFFDIKDISSGFYIRLLFNSFSSDYQYFYTKNFLDTSTSSTGASYGILFDEVSYGKYAAGRIYIMESPELTNNILWDGDLLTTDNSNDTPVKYSFNGKQYTNTAKTSFKLEFPTNSTDGTIWLYEIEK